MLDAPPDATGGQWFSTRSKSLRSPITIVHGDLLLSKALGLARQAAIVFLRLYKVFQGEHRSREDEIDVKFEGIDISPKGKGIIEFALEGIQDYWIKLN